MLLDPFEEQFDLPSAAVEIGDGQCWLGHVVGQEDQFLAGIGIDISDTAQRVGILLARVESGQDDGLIEVDPSGFVHRGGIAPLEFEIGLGSRNEERAGAMNAMQATEVDIATIHDIKSAGIEDHLVEDVDIVNPAGSNDDKGWEVSMQSQQCVQFDGSLRLFELCPREQRKAQVDGCRVQRIRRAGQFRSEWLPCVKNRGLTDQDVAEVAEDSPIPILVGIGKGAFGDIPANSGSIEFLTYGFEARLDIPQTFPIRQLGETHDQILAVTTQFANPFVAVVSSCTFVELVPWNEFHQLGKDGPTFLHDLSPFVVEREKHCKMAA